MLNPIAYFAGVMGDGAYIDRDNGHKYIFDAWLWFRICRQRCVHGHPQGPPSYQINVNQGQHVNLNAIALNDLIEEENRLCLDAPRDHNPYLAHTCVTEGCHCGCKADALPGYHDEGEVYDVVVVDGVQTLRGIACGNPGCTNSPLKNKRFCNEHQDLEDICAAHVGPGANDYCIHGVRPGHKTCEAHADIEALYDGELDDEHGYQRPRRADEEQHEWRARLNNYWRERKKHRYFANDSIKLFNLYLAYMCLAVV